MYAYERDPYCIQIDVNVQAVGKQDDRRYVVLDDTILYPEGGGQPCDRGWIGKTPVTDVQRRGEEILHFVEGDVGTGPAPLRIDWERRFDHMQQHTAQHLLTALAADRFGWPTTSFHLGADVSDVELDVTRLAGVELQALEEAVATTIRAALPVGARRVSRAQYDTLEVRTRGLPEGHTGDIRLVEIAGIDRNTCGGTHLRNTAEIESVVLLDTESMRGGTRLHWVAGGRVRRRLQRRERDAAAVRRLFETSDAELLDVAAGKLTRLEEAERTVKRLSTRLAAASALRLRERSDLLIEAHFEDSDGAFLQMLARELVNAGERRPALLTASGASGGFFVLCGAANPDLDLRALGSRIAELLEGRGGGSAEMIQGKAKSMTRRQEAVELLRNELPTR